MTIVPGAFGRDDCASIESGVDRGADVDGYQVHPFTRDRRLICDGMRLARSFALNHQVFLVRFDVVEECRREYRRQGRPAPSYAACVMLAMAQVLPRHPWLNVYLTPFPRRIVRFEGVDICYTVECLDEGAAPYVGFSCLRDASRLTLEQISEALSTTRAACDRGLPAARHPYARMPTVVRWLNYALGCALFPSKVRRLFGTVGFTSVGKWGAAITTPLAPRSLTVSLGAVDRQPLVVEDAVRPGLAAWITLTYDHRIADGGQVARLGSDMAAFLADFPESGPTCGSPVGLLTTAASLPSGPDTLVPTCSV